MRRRSKRDLLAIGLARTGGARALRALGAWHGCSRPQLPPHRRAATGGFQRRALERDACRSRLASSPSSRVHFEVVRPGRPLRRAPGRARAARAHHLRRRLPRQPRARAPAHFAGTGFTATFFVVPRLHRPAAVSRGGTRSRGCCARASAPSFLRAARCRSRSTCMIAPRCAGSSSVDSRRCPATGPRLSSTASAHATGTGRCPADEADGLWMTWDMARELRDGRHGVRRPHRRPRGA